MSAALPTPVKHGQFKPPAGAEDVYLRLGDGRYLMVRPLTEGAGVQLALIGKRGGVVDAAAIPLDSVPRFIALVDGVSEITWAAWEKFERRKQKELERRLAKGYAANPFTPEYMGKHPGRWKTAPRAPIDEPYLVRPR
jgi:hypothetical protein